MDTSDSENILFRDIINKIENFYSGASLPDCLTDNMRDYLVLQKKRLDELGISMKISREEQAEPERCYFKGAQLESREELSLMRQSCELCTEFSRRGRRFKRIKEKLWLNALIEGRDSRDLLSGFFSIPPDSGSERLFRRLRKILLIFSLIAAFLISSFFAISDGGGDWGFYLMMFGLCFVGVFCLALLPFLFLGIIWVLAGLLGGCCRLLFHWGDAEAGLGLISEGLDSQELENAALGPAMAYIMGRGESLSRRQIRLRRTVDCNFRDSLKIRKIQSSGQGHSVFLSLSFMNSVYRLGRIWRRPCRIKMELFTPPVSENIDSPLRPVWQIKNIY